MVNEGLKASIQVVYYRFIFLGDGLLMETTIVKNVELN